jgi:BirA family transcriptional regulator, biotin operon repressor / biotin---[acetyl-CoA-carboxylase] ligase
MLVLSDCPGKLAGLIPEASWCEVAEAALTATDRRVWRALGPAGRLWQGHLGSLAPPGFWSRALIVGEAPGSQFDALRELLGSDLELPGPTACLALSGRGFHGQRGRPWLAAPGNLHLCVAFPEPGLAARHASRLAALPTVSVIDAVRSLTGGSLQPGIKWVNDVLLDGCKIAGVLTSTQTQGDRIGAVLLGIGLNVATAPAVDTTPFVPSVGCLAEAGARVTVLDAFVAVLDALARRLGEIESAGPGPLLGAYRAASLVIGREVCVFEEAAEGPMAGSPARPFARGTVRGIGDDLSLVLDGVDAPVTRGRLAFAEHCDPLGR